MCETARSPHAVGGAAGTHWNELFFPFVHQRRRAEPYELRTSVRIRTSSEDIKQTKTAATSKRENAVYEAAACRDHEGEMIRTEQFTNSNAIQASRQIKNTIKIEPLRSTCPTKGSVIWLKIRNILFSVNNQ